mmetsp:Transcript_19041/g.44165  ORF Transcript_19041/g.44165 Transcript_19041/m.44165 type:complete len:374 (-) Transcript_19041:33-1154(-)
MPPGGPADPPGSEQPVFRDRLEEAVDGDGHPEPRRHVRQVVGQHVHPSEGRRRRDRDGGPFPPQRLPERDRHYRRHQGVPGGKGFRPVVLRQDPGHRREGLAGDRRGLPPISVLSGGPVPTGSAFQALDDLHRRHRQDQRVEGDREDVSGGSAAACGGGGFRRRQTADGEHQDPDAPGVREQEQRLVPEDLRRQVPDALADLKEPHPGHEVRQGRSRRQGLQKEDPPPGVVVVVCVADRRHLVLVTVVRGRRRERREGDPARSDHHAGGRSEQVGGNREGELDPPRKTEKEERFRERLVERVELFGDGDVVRGRARRRRRRPPFFDRGSDGCCCGAVGGGCRGRRRRHGPGVCVGEFRCVQYSDVPLLSRRVL